MAFLLKLKKFRCNIVKFLKEIKALEIDKRIGICLNTMIVIATLIYTGYGAFQLIEINNQGKILTAQIENTERQYRLENRAWVSIDQISHRDFKVGFPVIIELAINNSGQTPAIDVESVSYGDMVADQLYPTCLEKSKDNRKINVIAPNDLQTIVHKTGNLIKQINIDELNSGRVRYQFWGYIKYSDIFGGRHLTTFCGLTMQGTSDLEICNYGNSMD